MKKEDLKKKSLGFEYDPDLDEFYRKSVDKSQMGHARFELLKKGKRIGKLYWDEIRYVYGSVYVNGNLYGKSEKPFFEIKTLHGFNIHIYQNEYKIYLPIEKTEDACYIHYIPINFDTISFYLEFEWKVKINDLRKR